MKIIRIHLFLLLISASLIFSSCISFKREIVLNKDGSGKEKMTITFDKLFYEMISSMTSFMDPSRKEGFLDSLYNDEIFMSETRAKYDSIPGIKLIDFLTIKNPDSSNSFTIDYEFDSVYKIGSSSLTSVKAQQEEMSDATVLFDKSDNKNIIFRFNYQNKMYDSTMQNQSDTVSDQLLQGMADMFEGGKIEVTVDFPYEVISSNSDSSAGNRLFWNSSLKETILNKEFLMEAVMKEN